MKKYKDNTIVYLASPYTYNKSNWLVNKIVMYRRYRQISKVAAGLILQGHVVFAPISQSAPLVRYGNIKETEFGFWENTDLTFLSVCDEIMVCTMSGWEESYGVQCEIAYAKENSIPVSYLNPETLRITKVARPL